MISDYTIQSIPSGSNDIIDHNDLTIKNYHRKEEKMASQQWKTPPAMEIDPKKKYFITMDTNRGVIELELFPEHALLQ